MRIDPEEIRRRFAAMDDDGLLDVNPDELSELARGIYEEECARRGFDEEVEEDATLDAGDGGGDEPGGESVMDLEDEDGEDGPAWAEDAVCVCTFAAAPGSGALDDIVKARAVLLAAAIPCFSTTVELPPAREGHPPSSEVSIFVPGPLHLHAAAILDRDLLNANHEEEWRLHFEAISDEQLLALRPDLFTAGLVDRAARMKRVYAGEVARRGLNR
ncbi:MAG: hypothetical protein IT164_04680 [Bryobacterales bacterium]|nr:hypothetical protein [Bryobacterales bacterium]